MFVRLRPYVLVRRAGVVERVRKSKSRVRKAADCLEDDGKVVAERKDRSIWWNLPEQSSFGEADSGEGFSFFLLLPLASKRFDGGTSEAQTNKKNICAGESVARPLLSSIKKVKKHRHFLFGQQSKKINQV